MFHEDNSFEIRSFEEVFVLRCLYIIRIILYMSHTSKITGKLTHTMRDYDNILYLIVLITKQLYGKKKEEK